LGIPTLGERGSRSEKGSLYQPGGRGKNERDRLIQRNPRKYKRVGGKKKQARAKPTSWGGLKEDSILKWGRKTVPLEAKRQRNNRKMDGLS